MSLVDLKGITCPKCSWKGGMVELVANESFDVGCPQCGGLINREDYGISVVDFMALPDIEKPFFVQDDLEDDPCDVTFFCTESWPELKCRLCGGDHPGVLYGTGNDREAKLCAKHFVTVNKNSRFIDIAEGWRSVV